MNKENYMPRELFLNIINVSNLSVGNDYEEKLYEYVINMMYTNRVIYDIDVSGLEPMSVITCLKEAKN